MESVSNMVRIVDRVPPLAPELLLVVSDLDRRWREGDAYFKSSMQLVISLVCEEKSSRTRLTSDQASMSAGALSTPTEGMICMIMSLSADMDLVNRDIQ